MPTRAALTAPRTPPLSQFDEVERLSKLPPLEQVHTAMVAQMLPGTALQVPNVAAYLVSCLQTSVDMRREAEGGGGES